MREADTRPVPTTDAAGPRVCADLLRPERDLDPRPVVVLLLASLLPGESPRSQGYDAEHVARLVTVDQPLPPILVNRRTMQIIDGTHRMLAAVAQGRQTIEAELFDGTGEDAFLLAVSANVDHGLPLSRKDGWIAAKGMIASHPHLSDRSIACISGLSAKVVAALR